MSASPIHSRHRGTLRFASIFGAFVSPMCLQRPVQHVRLLLVVVNQATHAIPAGRARMAAEAFSGIHKARDPVAAQYRSANDRAASTISLRASNDKLSSIGAIGFSTCSRCS